MQHIKDVVRVYGRFDLDEDGNPTRLRRLLSIVPAFEQDAELVRAQLLALRDERADESSIAGPSEYALSTALRLVDDAYGKLSPPFPEVSASTDGEGGIQIYWDHSQRKVQLLIPSRADEQQCIYHQAYEDSKSVSDVDKRVTGPALSEWLNWLRG